MARDPACGLDRILIGSYGIGDRADFGHDGIIDRLTLIGAGGHRLGGLKKRHGDVFAREIDHRLVILLDQFQRFFRLARNGATGADDPGAA